MYNSIDNTFWLFISFFRREKANGEKGEPSPLAAAFIGG